MNELAAETRGMRGPNNDLLEALSITVIARFPELSRVPRAARRSEAIKGRQGEDQQRAGGEWRAGERVVEQAGGRAWYGCSECDVTGSSAGMLLVEQHLAAIR